MKEASATRLTTVAVGVDGATLGASGGGSQTLVTANLPAYTPAGSIVNGAITSTASSGGLAGGGLMNQNGGNLAITSQIITSTQAASTFIGTPQGGTSTPIKIAQPTIVCNYILRIL